MNYLELPLAFVDLETTGTLATRDRITEIAIVSWDGIGEPATWSHLVNPETRIPPAIEAFTGISNHLVAEAPAFSGLAAEVGERLAGHLFVAHNARFDFAFLKNEFRRVGFDFRPPQLCTVRLSRQVFPEFAHHGLDALIERHGLTVPGRHRALPDALALYAFWQTVRRTVPAEALSVLVQKLVSRLSLPAHVDAASVDALPTGHGVYIFYGQTGLPIYVGKSRHVRTRVLSHFAADHSDAKEMSLSQQVRRIEGIACAGEVDALLTEARLVKELQPTLNRQLRRNRELCSWRLSDQGLGYCRAELSYARDLDFGRQPNLYGLFRNRRAATTAMEEIARTEGLCLVALGLERGALGKPCFRSQLGRCRGACHGAESLETHSARLRTALSDLALTTWPFPGPAFLAEGEGAHVIDAWCYLGYARSDEDRQALLASGKPSFDKDTYRILAKEVSRMTTVVP
ncbi:3'-5' exonuclease family protein [Propionivibrio soli]|uniref:3'-5' exonuclease family protein n=1 Tax=Propionivibrio soli TaxID=2976531 RepID=UPI0021E7578D|nr:3'-5' exonuclease family protein [Propionivibrio soli]